MRAGICEETGVGMESSLGEVEVNTVDVFQGKDKEVILFSMAKGSGERDATLKLGSLLQDSKRLNVMLTRAQKKLVIVCSVETAKLYREMGRIVELVSRKGGVFEGTADMLFDSPKFSEWKGKVLENWRAFYKFV